MLTIEYDTFFAIFKGHIADAKIGEADDVDDILPLQSAEEAFTDVFLERLQDHGQIADCESLHFEKKLGSANAKLNAYCISEEEAHLDLVVSIYDSDASSSELRSVPAGELSKAIGKALHAYKWSEKPFYKELEESSPSYDMAKRFHELQGAIKRIRVVILVYGQTSKLPDIEQIENFPEIKVDVWDLERLFRVSASGLSYESISIDVDSLCGGPLPCISGDETSKDYRCHMSIFPGELLYKLYHEHGPRLLELNVRSFLQARTKVNRGIRDTITNEPEYFLAYNNGISATVEEIDIRERPDGGLGIYGMKGLQIVNGGQTTASIHRAKDRDKLDLEDVFVQVKITEVNQDKVDDLVPKISRYSNTQNKVSETDFSANHPFHVALQQLSTTIWSPGETARWFYERARGQWEVARVREGTPARIKAFDLRTPKKQKIDKVLVAKSMNSWDECPDMVSKGGQKNFVHFMSLVEKRGVTWEPDEKYYKDLVSKVILFKKAQSVARKHKFPGYRANAVCYTVALLAYRTASRVDFETIWENQQVSDSLENTLHSWMPRVLDAIVETANAQGKNVTEWCKKAECWAHVRGLNLEFELGFEQELAEGQALPTVGRGSKKKAAKKKISLTPEEADRQAKVIQYNASQWVDILSWAVQSGNFKEHQIAIASTVIGYAAAQWKDIPSPNQTKHIVDLANAWSAAKMDQNDE